MAPLFLPESWAQALVYCTKDNFILALLSFFSLCYIYGNTSACEQIFKMGSYIIYEFYLRTVMGHHICCTKGVWAPLGALLESSPTFSR